MDEAIVVFSRKGLFTDTVKARDIRSRAQARKLWPLVAPDNMNQMVVWVSPSFKNDKPLRRSHFRLMPTAKPYNVRARFDDEEITRQLGTCESAEHKRAKELIAAELTRRIENGLGLPWSFKDDRASDFHLEGNLLLGADTIGTEITLKTPFGSRYRLDVGVLGKSVFQGRTMVLGGVEIELTHEFDGRKALICKTIGFPLISINISEMALDEITPDWARHALTDTTNSDEQRRRYSYIYLHDILYPQYAQLPPFVDEEQRHQYLVFADDAILNKLKKVINQLSSDLKCFGVTISLVNAKSDQARTMLENTGAVVGSDWRDFNDHQCLKITIPRPKGTGDVTAHKFHMTMARLLLNHTNALVGYKYKTWLHNLDKDEDIWLCQHIDRERQTINYYRVLPKRLAEPIDHMMKIISQLKD